MWSSKQISVEIEEVDHPVMEVVIGTPVGTMRLMANVSITNRILRLDLVHVEGLKAGALERTGLNAIGRKLMELADVDQVIVQGSARTTGKNRGRTPRPIRFPRQVELDASRR
jgi:hypothetical protein